MNMQFQAPILGQKNHTERSVFRPENMLRESRRQKSLSKTQVPRVCVLDPDGDLALALQKDGRATKCEGWACYHTVMNEFAHEGLTFGIIGNAVGAAFSVLLAEQAFASGCELLISISSAGQIVPAAKAPYFILIDRALRDEGTSYHYLPPARYVAANAGLIKPVAASLQATKLQVLTGASWTTDAPFRETATAIAAARAEGILAVEMEAAALYAFAEACAKKIICFAQITNQMGQIQGDFEKGEGNGAQEALSLLVIAARAALMVG